MSLRRLAGATLHASPAAVHLPATRVQSFVAESHEPVQQSPSLAHVPLSSTQAPASSRGGTSAPVVFASDGGSLPHPPNARTAEKATTTPSRPKP